MVSHVIKCTDSCPFPSFRSVLYPIRHRVHDFDHRFPVKLEYGFGMFFAAFTTPRFAPVQIKGIPAERKNIGKYPNHVYRTYMCTIDPGTLVRMYILFWGLSQKILIRLRTPRNPHTRRPCALKPLLLCSRLYFCSLAQRKLLKVLGDKGFSELSSHQMVYRV